MNKDQIMRFINGYIEFSVSDGFSDVFFAACKKNDIILNNIHSGKNEIIAVVRYKDFSGAKVCAEKAGMNIKLLKRSGVPYIFSKYRLRLGIPIGILVGLILFFVLSSVVWSVEISGCQSVSKYDVEKVLNENSVKVGAFTDGIDCKVIELKLCDEVEGVLKATVNMFGCKIFVDITEATETPDMLDKEQYTNLIASKDGEIVRCDVFAGESEVSVGMPVVKGDLLVSGVETLKDNTVRYIHSKAEIIARTVNVLSTNTALNFTAQYIAETAQRYSLYLFGMKIPLWFLPSTENVHTNRYLVDTENTVFPLGIIRESTAIFEKSQITLSEQQGRLICLNDFALCALKELKDVVIVEKQSNILISNQIKFEVKYICEENIVEEVIFEVVK